MEKSKAIYLLRKHQDDLQQAGIQHLALFGSVARDEQTPDSDVDVLATLDPAKDLTLLDVVRLQRHISELLSASVHITLDPVQKPRLRETITKEAVRAF